MTLVLRPNPRSAALVIKKRTFLHSRGVLLSPDPHADTAPVTHSVDPSQPHPDRLPNGRPRLRPLIGVPRNIREDRKTGLVVAVLFHALLVLLVALPAAYATTKVLEVDGAGGKGPAGGGGGGTGGLGGIPERIRFTPITPAAAAPTPQPTITPPVVKPPEVKPPVVPPTPPQPQPVAQPKPATTAPPASAQVTAATPGTGGGSGTDGSAGSGPGSGGGIGSGQGTGTGSSVGPGTGGGNATIYPPTPTQLILPPQPIPGKVRGQRLVATFDVDSTGKVLAFDFAPPTRDNGYNARLREVLAEVRFRPGVRSDGRPVRTPYSFTIEF